MRINSSFKDYYDSLQTFSQEFDFIYQRFPKFIEIEDKNLHKLFKFQSLKNHCGESRVFRNCGLYINEIEAMYFCGKFYIKPILIIPPKENEVQSTSEFRKSLIHCYSIEHIDNFVNRFHKEDMIGANYWENHRKFWVKGFTEFDIEKTNTYYQDIFKQYNSPIFLIREFEDHKTEKKLIGGKRIRYYGKYITKYSIEYNFSLNDIQFLKVSDSYQTYQEIMMYLSNLAVPLKDIPQPNDKIKAELAGFDKFSFRKDKKGSAP